MIEQTPIETNSEGGSQSALLSYDKFILEVLPHIRQILERANFKYDVSRYGKPNWHLISVKDHTNHALAHLMRFQQHNTVGMGHLDAYADEDDLMHAAIRCLFAWYLNCQEDI